MGVRVGGVFVMRDKVRKVCRGLIDLVKNLNFVLAGVAQQIECQPANQRVAGSIPSQGTCPGCGQGPQ